MANAPVPLSELIPVSPATSSFEDVPNIMEAKGRVSGFEAMRDMILSNWRALAAEYEIPLPALLKLVLETDRHALFAAMAEEKMGDADRSKQKKWAWFQEFLEGKVDVPLSPDEKLSELPGPSGVATLDSEEE